MNRFQKLVLVVVLMVSLGLPIQFDSNVAQAAGVLVSAEIPYLIDQYTSQGCNGPTNVLNYVVFYPAVPGHYPIVFASSGTAFDGSAGCEDGVPRYRASDPIMKIIALAGFVVVNIQYHGADDGLYGDLTYPGPAEWGNVADGSVELNLKPAVRHFFSDDPVRWGADETKGVFAFGGSSGGHNAYMLAITGVAGHTFQGALGWSGMPEAQAGGAKGREALDAYMRTTPGSDVEAFGDPLHRVGDGSPPQYVVNSLREFIDPRGALDYVNRCKILGVVSWLRLLDSTSHSADYMGYVFTGRAPEQAVPKAFPGTTVMQDTLRFLRAMAPPHP
jgi:hypothetical protein